MQEDKIKCCTYYRKEAAVYDSRRFNCNCRKYYDDLFKKIIHDYVKDAEIVLDAGTGTGRFAIYLAKMGKKVVALDQSAEMLEVARKKSDEHGVSGRIEFIQGDLEDLPLNENSFDAIVSIHVLVHFKLIEKIILEFSRVLKPNGILVFDLSESGVARFYHFMRAKILRMPFSFRDYFHKVADVEADLAKGGIVINTPKRVKKFPRFFIHLLTCTFHLKLLLRLVDIIEKANYGVVTLLKCTKEQ